MTDRVLPDRGSELSLSHDLLSGLFGLLSCSAGKRVLLWGSCAIVLVVLVVLGPHLAIHDPIAADLAATNQAPGGDYLLGTDAVGRCVLCRILAGTQSSLLAAGIVVVVCFVIGSLMGTISGFFGGKVDSVFMRITDAFMAFPQLVLSIAVAGLLGGGIVNAIIALCVPGWTRFARLARGQVLSLKGRTFILAERAGGLSGLVIVVKHMIPSIVPVLLVTAFLDLGATVLNLAGLSFLGLGAQPPAPELGAMINQAASTFQLTPWGVFAPGVVLFVIVLVFNMLGDALNDLLGAKGEDGVRIAEKKEMSPAFFRRMRTRDEDGRKDR